MATLLHSESTRLYSWWWDSHISPKNSKWLQENLADMDTKVKAMIKLIEEDADSFARRAEMFYKKRPELMKLVEEFYRAYRALAERYDHATGELRQAHRTMAEAFPNQVPFVLADDSPSGSAQGTEPHTPEMPHPVRALFGPDDLHKDALGLSASDLHSVKKNGSYSGDSDAVSNKKGPKQLYEMFGSGKVRKGLNHDMEEKEESLTGEVFQLSNENENLKTKVLSESERAGKAESEVQNLKKALIDVQAEKEAVLSQYQQSLEKLSSLEGELICAEKDLSRLKVQASKAESEFLTLKETIIKLEAERDAGLTKIKDCLERISCLEDVGVEVLAHENICQELVEDQNSPIPDGILDLQKLQNRIKAVEKVLVEEMNRVERQESSSSNNIKLEAAVREIESLKSKCRPFQEKDKQKEEERGLWDETSDNLKLQKAKPEHPEVKNGILMKDIPLDQVSDCSLYGRSRRGNSQADEQMLVLWETSDNYRSSVGQNLTELQKQDYETIEDDIVYNQFEDADQRSNNPSSELEMEELGVDKLQVSTSVSMPNRGGNKKKILERLASDGQKLANIQTSVDDLRRKLETNKKSKNSKNVDFQTVKEQLQEVEETAVQLFDLNVQMARKIEGIPFSSDGKGSTELDEAVSVQKKRVLEQARKGSEKIGRLQLEIQKIQDVLLKLEDEKKSKGKNRFSRTKSRTTIILRDFIHSGKRSSVRQNKDRPCGCFKPSASGEANI